MATLDEWSGGTAIKMLYLGDAASGKSGSLASLVEAGYNLRIIDFDKGVGVLRNILKEKNPELLKKVDVESYTDKFANVNGRLTCLDAKAWSSALQKVSNWQPYGPLETWTTKDILVIDSLTFAGKAAMNYVLKLNGRLGTTPYNSDYKLAQDQIENFVMMLHSTAIPCNVIVISHIKEVGKYEHKTDSKGNPIRIPIQGTEKGYAETGTGQALSPTMARHFNSVLLADVNYGKREIFTQPQGNIALKSAGGQSIPKTLPLDTGLATYFKLVQG